MAELVARGRDGRAQLGQAASPARAHGPGDARRGPVLTEDAAQRTCPLAGRDTRAGALQRRLHEVHVRTGVRHEAGQGGVDGQRVSLGAPLVEGDDGALLDRGIDAQDRCVEVLRERARLGGRVAVDADDHLVAGLDATATVGMGGHQGALQVAALHGRDRATHLLDPGHLLTGRRHDLRDLGLDHVRAVEDVLVLEQVGLQREHLLHAQAPLLVPRPRQSQRLVPCRQLHRTRPRPLRQRDAEHLQHDALDVVLRLRLRQAERVHLHAVAEPAGLLVGDAVPLARDLVPELDEGAHLAHLLDEPDARVHEERDAGDDVASARPRAPARSRGPRRARRRPSTARRPPPGRASHPPPAGGTSRC